MNDIKYMKILTKSWYNNYFKFIKDNIYRLDLTCLSQNPNITFDNIKDTIDDPRFKWKWYHLSRNLNITFDNIRETIDDQRFKWEWLYLSQHPNITILYIIYIKCYI